ncbi:MAG: gamma-glutamylcyclotransferase [Acidobacteria bacterium]|nr:gamma-glutamylcyclotransferase [Acidobacteriota bacterium]
MRKRCPEARFVSSATLTGWRFLINSNGWATIVPAPEDVVFGCLWILSEADEHRLDSYEDVAGGLYEKTIVFPGPKGDRAMTYVATNRQPGSPNPDYLERIIGALENLDAPPEYVSSIVTRFPPGKSEGHAGR